MCLDKMWFKVMSLRMLGSSAGLMYSCPRLPSMPASVLQPTTPVFGPLLLVSSETSHGDTCLELQKYIFFFFFSLRMLFSTQINFLT